MKDRRFHKRACANPQCRRVSWTSVSLDKDYICASCKRAAGETGTGKRGEGNYSSMAIVPKQDIVFGTCPCCGRPNQRIVNGRCDDARFYGMNDIDPDLSARARRGRGGVNDWVRRKR